MLQIKRYGKEWAPPWNAEGGPDIREDESLIDEENNQCWTNFSQYLHFLTLCSFLFAGSFGHLLLYKSLHQWLERSSIANFRTSSTKLGTNRLLILVTHFLNAEENEKEGSKDYPISENICNDSINSRCNNLYNNNNNNNSSAVAAIITTAAVLYPILIILLFVCCNIFVVI